MEGRLPHRFVFIFGLLFGGSIVLLSPPFSSPDEPAHFYRAYHLAEGKLYASKREGTTGDDLPSSLTDVYAAVAESARSDAEFEISWTKLEKASRIPLDPARRQFTAFANTALYSPVAYLPQAIAIRLARLAEQSPLRMIYLARTTNLIAYLLLAAAAVWLTPVLKWAFALAALVPMSIYLAASISADAMTIGLAMLAIAWTLRLALASGQPAVRGLLFLGLLLILLALSKQAYAGLALLVFMIPGAKFSGSLQRWLIAALLIGVPVALAAAWSYSLHGLYTPFRPSVDPAGNVRWIFNHPWSYLAAMFKSIYRPESHGRMIGVLGWLGPQLPGWVCGVYWAAMGVVSVLDGGRPVTLSLRSKAAVFGVYVFTAAVMASMVYLSSEAVGSKSVESLQPRYFLPLLPLLLLLIRGGAKLAGSHFSRAVVPRTAIAAISIGACATWWTLVKRYYW